MRLIVTSCVLVAAAAVALTATAQAASPKVLASSRSAGQFAITSASASKDQARAMYVRAYGRDLSSFVVVACARGFSVGSRSQDLHSMRSGALYRVKLPFAGDCDVTASLSGAGSIRLQILG